MITPALIPADRLKEIEDDLSTLSESAPDFGAAELLAHVYALTTRCELAESQLSAMNLAPTAAAILKESARLTARCEALELALDPRRWDMPMMRAWHANIPDTEAAFRALRESAMTPADGTTAGEQHDGK